MKNVNVKRIVAICLLLSCLTMLVGAFAGDGQYCPYCFKYNTKDKPKENLGAPIYKDVGGHLQAVNIVTHCNDCGKEWSSYTNFEYKGHYWSSASVEVKNRLPYRIKYTCACGATSYSYLR